MVKTGYEVRDRDMHPEDIKAAVRKRGATLASLARKLGISRQSMTITLIKPSARNESISARTIGVHPSAIWPSRYHENGNRRRPQPPCNYRLRGRRAITDRREKTS